MVSFIYPDDVPDDANALNEYVYPPDWVMPEGCAVFDGRYRFIEALTKAVRFLDRFGSTKLLDGLRKLYPKEVAEQLPEAESRARKTEKVRLGATA